MLGKIFASTKLSPLFWTSSSLAFSLFAGFVYGFNILSDPMVIGSILVLISGFFDIVDGQVACYTKKISRKGEFIDSVFDRIAEFIIYLGLLVGSHVDPYMLFLVATLSLIVSYIRSKAELIGIKLQGIGIGERAERLSIIVILGILKLIEVAIIIIIILSIVTILQRLITTIKSM